MKITEKLLLDMGFKVVPKASTANDIMVYKLKTPHGDFGVTHERESPVWYFDGHACTDIEEFIGFACQDGFEAGKSEAKHQMRKVLGVEDDT